MTTTKLDPKEAAAEDCQTAIDEGADPADLARADQLGADEALINAMGRAWVLDAAGAPDHSDDSWDLHGLPWCAAYAAAYREHAAARAA